MIKSNHKNLSNNIMSSLPEEVKWAIWTFVNGEPHKNWKIVWHELRIKLNNLNCIDMEESCQACGVVRWSKEMLSVKHNTFKNTTIFYCSSECFRSHYKRPINPKSLIFAI